MNHFRTLAAVAASGLALASPAGAQDTSHAGHGTQRAAAMTLPEACRTGEAPPMPDMDMHAMMQAMGEAQQAMMGGMMRTQEPMMQGMMAEDPDVAFACAMIPHHQGAIEMAEAQLQHGDAEEMKQMARTIIEDQRREIAELTRWLEEQGGQ